jgi:hypothetical protein
VQVGQKQAVAAKKGLVVTVCVWAAYGECHAATAMVINCQLSARSGHPELKSKRPSDAAGKLHAEGPPAAS